MTTPEDLIASANALADVITRENAAIEAVDLAGAAALARDKQNAADRFVRARAEVAGLTRAHASILLPLGDRLDQLAALNRTLLERAIMVQGRVIDCIVRAIPRGAEAPRYRADGVLAASRQPVALIARA